MDADRRFKDGAKLIKKGGYKVEFDGDEVTEFTVQFEGPKDSAYHGYKFNINVELPEGYPQKPPIVNFKTKIFHPNIDLESGFMCVSALDNEDWDPNFELQHVFDFIIPQLLLCPNADDPYNDEAAEIYNRDQNAFKEKAENYCLKYATPM